jgi:hypothetical protein
VADVSSNLARVELLLDELADGFSFSTPGAQASLGRELADIVVDGIADRSIGDQAAPDGSQWPELSPKYLASKVRQGYPATIGVRTGQMLSRVELAGDVSIGASTVTIRYGATAEARQKMEWFSKRRPAWGLDAEIVRALDAHARAALASWLDGLGR